MPRRWFGGGRKPDKLQALSNLWKGLTLQKDEKAAAKQFVGARLHNKADCESEFPQV